MPYADAMKKNIAGILGITTDDVSVKATTTEKMGFAGREEGLFANATVLLRKKIIMASVKIRTVNNSGNELPHYATAGAAGMDIRANLSVPVTLASLERRPYPFGYFYGDTGRL